MTKAFELLSLLVSARRFQQLVLTTPGTNRFAPVGWINFFSNIPRMILASAPVPKPAAIGRDFWWLKVKSQN